MKKKRLFLIAVVSIIMVLAFMLGSPFFKLQNVEIKFINDKNEVVLLEDNVVFNNSKKVNQVISSAKFDYGSSLFLINKQDYVSRLDKNNPYFKLVNISSVFPNKMVVYAKEREPVFYISNNEDYFLLDRDFKILEITNNVEKINNLILISAKERNLDVNFFEFFDVSSLAFEPSQYLYENNLIMEKIKNIVKVINNFDCFSLNQNIFKSLVIYEKDDFPNLILKTNEDVFGIKLEVENILENFDKKLHKLLCAFKTLINQEKIKTTYGVLSINNFLNCFWNNL